MTFMRRAATADAAGGTPYVDNVVREQEYLAAHPGCEIRHAPDECSPTGEVWACVADIGGQPGRIERTSLGQLLDMLEMLDAREADLGELRAVYGDEYEDIAAEHGIWQARQRGGDGRVFAAASAGELDAELHADQVRRRAS